MLFANITCGCFHLVLFLHWLLVLVTLKVHIFRSEQQFWYWKCLWIMKMFIRICCCVDQATCEVIDSYVPITVLCSRSGDGQWFDANCWRAKQTAYAWCSARNADNLGQFVLVLLRPRGSMVLQGSLIMNTSGILWSTQPVHISGVRHWKTQSLLWNILFLLAGGGLVVAPRKPHHSWALCLTASNDVNGWSLLHLVSLCLGAILWPSRHVLLLIIWVCFQEGCRYYCFETKHNFLWAHLSWIISGVLVLC